MNWISTQYGTMSKAEIKANGMFGYELIEEAVTDAMFYQHEGGTLLGTLCRTSSGIRFVVDGGVYLALENEEIDTVKCHLISAVGCTSWKNLGCKTLTFNKLDSLDSISFAVTDAVAKSWVKHFDVE